MRSIDRLALLVALGACSQGDPAPTQPAKPERLAVPERAATIDAAVAAPSAAIDASVARRDRLGPQSVPIVDRPIDFSQERIGLMLGYRQRHSDPKATGIGIEPKMIVIHYTAGGSADGTWRYFNRVRAEKGRTKLAAAGAVNVSAHFVVDRDGTVFRLMPETWMARHVIGLNHVAIGVENVGDEKRYPLTDAQLEANERLVRYLADNFPIEYLIGHYEYRHFDGTPLFRELDHKYRNSKGDPGERFMKALRERVAELGLKGPPS